MTLALGSIPLPESAVSRLDPRWKLAGVVTAAAAATVLRTVPAAAAALGAAVLLAGVGRVPWRWYLGRIGLLLPFLLLFALPLPFVTPDPAAWSVGPLEISPRGIRLALLLTCKALTVATLMLVLLASAPLTVTFQAAHRLRVPGLLVQLALLTYRYVFLLAEELRRLRVALRVRGFRRRADRHTYRTVGHVAGTLLVRSYERAETVGQAMRCRGFDGRFRSLTDFHTRAADVFFFFLTVGAAAALIVWDYRT